MLNSNIKMTARKFYKKIKDLKDKDIDGFSKLILSNFDKSYYEDSTLVYEYKLKDKLVNIKLVDFNDTMVTSMYQLGLLTKPVDLRNPEDIKKVNDIRLKNYYEVLSFTLSFYDDDIIAQLKKQTRP